MSKNIEAKNRSLMVHHKRLIVWYVQYKYKANAIDKRLLKINDLRIVNGFVHNLFM